MTDNFPVKRKTENNEYESKKGKQSHHQDNSEVEFQVHPRRKYGGPQTNLRNPMLVGDFCLDHKRTFFHDQRNLNFITMDWKDTKKVSYDLNIGIEKVKRKKYEETRLEKLDRLLEWILHNAYKFHTNESKGKPLKCLSTDFMCFRGLLTELMCTPYESREGWIICATKYCGTIYLCAYDTPSRIAQKENETETQKKMCSWGYKFEQYMTDGGDLNEAVDENVEYCCVLRSRLGNQSLVYGAEVDGADPELYQTPHSDLSAFVELKTSKELVLDRDYNTLHRFKLIKWWAQSKLVGIPRVVAGFRDQDGVVNSLKTFSVEEIPSIGKDYWQPNIMFNFLDQFLNFVKQQVRIDDPRVVYQFQREPNNGNIYCTFCDQEDRKSVV